MDEKTYNEIVGLAADVERLKHELATKEARLRFLLEGTRKGTATTSPDLLEAVAKSTATPVTVRAEQFMRAAGRRVTFRELYEGVLRGGPATKFALKAYTIKARDAGQLDFDGKTYGWLHDGQKKKGRTPVKESSP